MKLTATIELQNDAKTTKEGLVLAKETLKALGLKGEVKPSISTRTLNQNSALHLFFTQLAQELNEHGLDMRHLIRQEVEIQWTPYSIKEYLWRPLQKVLTGKASTTKLDRSQEINLIYDNLNRIIIERTKGEINFPSFPCLESQIDEDNCKNYV
jgi:hypothetical protein